MQALTDKKTFCLGTTEQLDPVKTFECGQCFRWNADSRGVYTGVAFGRAARVFTENGRVYITSSGDDDEELWHSYFDLGLDYDAACSGMEAGEYFERCREFGRGIRILRQDRWEALCSFIISQCNNIPRIKGIVEKLCLLYGDSIDFEGERFFAFPPPERLALLDEAELAPLRCGYRAPYIINAARAVSTGELDLEELARADTETAMKGLLSLRGVGAKVANCAVLFGLGHMEAFPIDVWMKRALKEHFPPDFDPKSFGRYAGLAQQYIFYYARSGGRDNV